MSTTLKRPATKYKKTDTSETNPVDAVALEQSVTCISNDLNLRPTDTPVPMPTDHQEYLGYIWQELPRLSAMILRESENMEILCFNEIMNLRKEHEILDAKKNELERTLATEMAFRDATVAFLRGAAPKSRHYEEAKQQLFVSTKQIAKTLMTLNKVTMRMVTCLKNMMEHNTAVLSTYFYHAEKGSRMSYIFDADKTHRMMTTLKKATDKLKADLLEKEGAIADLTEETTRLKHKCMILSDELEKQKHLSASLYRESKLWAETGCTQCVKLLRELKKTQSEVETLTSNLALLSKQQSAFESYSASCTPNSSRPVSTDTMTNKIDSESQTDMVLAGTNDESGNDTSDTSEISDNDSQSSLARSPSIMYHRLAVLEDTVSFLRSELEQKSSDLALSEESHDEIVALLQKRDDEIIDLNSKIAYLQTQIPKPRQNSTSSIQTDPELVSKEASPSVPLSEYETLYSDYEELLARFTHLESTYISQCEKIDSLTSHNDVSETRWQAICDIIQSVYPLIPDSFYTLDSGSRPNDPISVLDALTRYLLSLPAPAQTVQTVLNHDEDDCGRDQDGNKDTIEKLEADLVASRLRIMELENKVNGWSITPDLVEPMTISIGSSQLTQDEKYGVQDGMTTMMEATRKEAQKMLDLNLCTMEELELMKEELSKMKVMEKEMKEVQQWIMETVNVLKNEKSHEKTVSMLKRQLSRFVNRA